jgi:glycosyltransferase involved in cell wall biosynthesis
VKRILTLSIDQLYRPQPGGIATYVRGLIDGLAELDSQFDVVGIGPRGEASIDVGRLPMRVNSLPLPIGVETRLWPFIPLGVPRDATIVHATSMSGPFAGGVEGAVHSVAMHDLLWRDEPATATRRGIAFHNKRLELIRRREDLRIFTTSPSLAERLSGLGIGEGRIHFVRLGVDGRDESPTDEAHVREFLAAHGVHGPFTLYAGTREPRKNLTRLIEAHRRALRRNFGVGPLVFVGPEGWGGVATSDAVVLGTVERSLLLGLYREATVFAYVALAEGWGLPPVEALHAGTRVVVSATTPSVAMNSEVIRVDPMDVDAIAAGLLEAMEQDDGTSAKSARATSVADLTWRNAALDHVEGWK